jgi:hypothetical protein
MSRKRIRQVMQELMTDTEPVAQHHDEVPSEFAIDSCALRDILVREFYKYPALLMGQWCLFVVQTHKGSVDAFSSWLSDRGDSINNYGGVATVEAAVTTSSPGFALRASRQYLTLTACPMSLTEYRHRMRSFWAARGFLQPI